MQQKKYTLHNTDSNEFAMQRDDLTKVVVTNYAALLCNREKMLIVEYVEGDVCETQCENPSEYIAQLADHCNFARDNW